MHPSCPEGEVVRKRLASTAASGRVEKQRAEQSKDPSKYCHSKTNLAQKTISQQKIKTNT
jgi:hypothetical protein